MSNTVKLPTCPKCGLPIPKEAPQGLCPKCVLLGAATATEQGVPATATSEIPSIERISKAFPQLEVLELIGRGGMGFVFKARQPHLDRFVALKLLPDKLAKDAQFAERFNREGRVLAKLNHPNIVSVFDFGQTGGFYYLTMEYVDGVNLRQAMRAGRFSPAEALSIVPKVCEALQYAHEQGILHRDIKPENILLDAKGRVKIADFGIAKLVGEDQPNITLTNTGAALGTPHYMAPEQLEKPSTVDHRADIYSLGVVFYEMLTGELPIGRFAAPSSKTPVNSTVDDVVFRTLEKDRELRFQSAGEMRTQVEHLGEGANAVPTSQDSSTVAPGEKRRVSEWSLYGAFAVALSLPLPLMAIVAIINGHGRIKTGELLITLGSVALPGLGGTLLGWLGLNEIRESGGRVRGLPLALFATLFWPLTILGAVTVGALMYLLLPVVAPTAAHTVGRFLLLLLPAAVIAFSFWTIHATTRWASQKPHPQQRGVLKWVFIVVLLIGMGGVLMKNKQHQSSRAALSTEPEAAALTETPAPAAPMIQFTFTSVELRDEQGARWLTMNFVQQVRGDCEHTFRYDARVPGFTAQTRKDSHLSDAKAGFAPVLHQRILWKLPDSLPQDDALALRDSFAKEWIGKSAVIGPDNERSLFEASVPDGGTLAAAVGVRLKHEDASQNAQKEVVPPPSPNSRVASPSANSSGPAAELWSPKIAASEKPNVSEILQEAKRLTDAGRYEEALQRHIWYHNHALEIEPNQSAVRLSFAISYWSHLGQRYPKAHEALITIRNRNNQKFELDGGSFALFQETAAINGYLMQQDATLALYTGINRRDSKLARQCYIVVEDLLIERGEYSFCASVIKDFQGRFDSDCNMYAAMLRPTQPYRTKPGDHREDADRRFVKKCRALIEILVGIGRMPEAENFRQQALAILDATGLKTAVTDAEARVKSMKAQPGSK